MPIALSCDCGKRLRVPDEHAGKKIKCPGCGDPLRVPDDSDSPARSAGAFIRFECECGKQLQVQAEYAGKMTRCPGCGSKQEIPDEDEAEKREVKSRIQAERPSARKAAPQPVREDEDEEDDRPSRKERERDRDPDEDEPREDRRRKRGRKKPQRAIWPFVVAGMAALVLLIGGGGFAAYWFLWGGSSIGEKAFIPSDAQGFFSIRVSETIKIGSEHPGFRAQGGIQDQAQKLTNEMGVQAEDIERMTGVVRDFQQQLTWVVITTKKPYDRKMVLTNIPNAKTAKHEGKTYHIAANSSTGPRIAGFGGGLAPVGMGPGGPSQTQKAAFFAGPKVLVLADNEASIKLALSTASKKSVNGALSKAISQMDGSRHLYGAMTLPVEVQHQIRQGAQGLPPQAKAAAPLMEMTGGTLAMTLGPMHVFELTLTFPDEARAQKAKTAVDGLLGMAELFLLPMVQDKQAQIAIRDVLKNLVCEQRGTDLYVKIQVADKVLEAAIPPQFRQPGGFPGG